MLYILVTLGTWWKVPYSAKGIVLSIAISVLLVLLFAYQLFVTFKFGAKSRYAEAQPTLHACQHELRDLYRYLSRCLSEEHPHQNIQFEDRELVERLVTAMTALNTAFCITTACNCRVSIKLLGAEEGRDPQNTDNLYLRTVARDETSRKKKEHDDRGEGTKHKLNANSDFQGLYQEIGNYFFNGSLWKDTSYRNSNDGHAQPGNTKRKDYNSTIVWPIRYKLQPDEPPEPDNPDLKQILLGFLTVDSLTENAFQERYDVDMGAQVADTLYVVLERYREIKNKGQAAHDNS